MPFQADLAQREYDIEELKAQRDELLAVTKRVLKALETLDFIRAHMSDGGEVYAIVLQARDAIARAEEKGT